MRTVLELRIELERNLAKNKANLELLASQYRQANAEVTKLENTLLVLNPYAETEEGAAMPVNNLPDDIRAKIGLV